MARRTPSQERTAVDRHGQSLHTAKLAHRMPRQMAATVHLDQIKLVISAAVDGSFYTHVYGPLDSATHPVTHYALAGWREGRDPAPWFSTAAYLAANGDVAVADVNPFHHFLVAGRREGREVSESIHAAAYWGELAQRGGDVDWGSAIAPVRQARRRAVPDAGRRRAPSATPPPEALSRAVRAAVTAAFDPSFYLGANPDVAADGVDPLEHYLTSGWREGRDPSPQFSLADYLDAYPDIAAAGVNPLVHYVTAGRAEGRTPRLELGFRYRMIAELAPLTERVAHAASASARVAVGDDTMLAAAFGGSRTGWRDLHLTFSHDDFSTNLGGVQICLQREAARFADLGRDHLHLFPAAPWPVIRAAGEPGPLGVLWNGEPLGAFDTQCLVRAISEAVAANPAGVRSFAIHSLLGHRVDETIAIIKAAGLSEGFFWLHDFASLCAGVHLLRNDVADCGAPAPDSPACGVCVYQPLRGRHLDDHGRLFDALRLTVVAPSEPTLATWKASWTFPAAAEIVHPHALLAPRAAAPQAPSSGRFRFAFVGLPVSHKGWPIFRELALRFADDPRYAFLHLGARAEGGLPVEHHPVSVGEPTPLAMQTALERLGVDAAMVWPLCRETFSFTAYEAAAAGAAVVTGPDSGNVAAFVAETGLGLVLEDETALEAAFASGAILALARNARRQALFDLRFSGLTADLVPGGAA